MANTSLGLSTTQMVLLSLDDVEMLQDLIVAATNEAMRQVEEKSQAEMSKVTGGMGLGF